jgi:glutathione S-transferase
LGDTLSVVDIAWFIYAHRLISTGYPFMRLNPSLASWYRALLARPEFAKEVTDPLRLRVIRFFTQKYQALTHTTLQNVTGV